MNVPTYLHRAVIVALSVALSACSGGSRHITPEGEIIAENLLLPVEAGIYRMWRVDERGGTLVRYAPPDSLDGTLPPIDVSVYRIRHPIEEEVAQIRAAAMQRNNSAMYEIEGTVYDTEGMVILPSGDTIYRAIVDMTVSTTPQRQMLYIHQEGGRYVNISTTFVRVRGMNIEPLFDQVVAEMIGRIRVAPDEAP